MGEGLFERFPEITEVADSILGYSIQSLCLEDTSHQLNQTQYTQPALFTVNALSYLKIREDGGRTPDFVAGHSLGEYNALLAAETFDFKTGLTLVKKRGELMGKETGGGMAAVIGLTLDQVQDVLLQYGNREISIANINSPQQIIITGRKDEIPALQSSFEKAGARRYLPLNVSGAFHSPLMEPARIEFEEYLGSFSFSPPKIPVISNVEAAPYPENGIAELLAKQITSPVRWVETIQYFRKLPEPSIEEIGPGNVLKGLLRQI